jgi:hypothetical protein
MVTSLITQTKTFYHTHRLNSFHITVRAGTTLYIFGGTLHKVIRYNIHGSYNPSNGDYDVAVLQVCIDCLFQ